MTLPINTQPHKSSLGGIDANVMAMLSYLAALIVGFVPFNRPGFPGLPR